MHELVTAMIEHIKAAKEDSLEQVQAEIDAFKAGLVCICDMEDGELIPRDDCPVHGEPQG